MSEKFQEVPVKQHARIRSFAEFWPYYVRQQAAPGCRALHFVGSTLGLVCLLATLITGQMWLLLLNLTRGLWFCLDRPFLR